MKRPRGEPRTRYLSGGGSHAGLLVAVVAIIVVTVGAYWAGRWRASTGRARADAPAMDAGFVGLEPREIDLGDQLWGQSIPLEFLFVNESRLPVSIGSIESSCGCLVIDSDAWNGRVVQPGELVSMDVMLDTENNPGAKVRRLDLTLDSGERYSARIVVNVYGTWSVAPNVLDFGEVTIDGAADDQARLTVFQSESDELLDVAAPEMPWLQWRTAPRGPGRVDILLGVLRAELPPGQNSASLVVRTSSTIKPTGVVFVKARGVHELTMSPRNVFLVGAAAQRIEFFDRSGKRTRIVSVDTNRELLDAGAIILCNARDEAPRESVAVRVVDDGGRCRNFRVSMFH